MFGSDENLDHTDLMRLAGRLSRRLRAFAKARGIPLVDCSVGERKSRSSTSRPTKSGRVFSLILVSRAPAAVWEADAKSHHLERKHPLPYVEIDTIHRNINVSLLCVP